MNKVVVMVLVAMMFFATTCGASAKSSDYELAKEWANAHCNGAVIERVVTKSKGGKKGVVKGTKYTVKYPKKVKKGKKVVVYMVEVNGEVEAMVCLGKVK